MIMIMTIQEDMEALCFPILAGYTVNIGGDMGGCDHGQGSFGGTGTGSFGPYKQGENTLQ